MEQYELVRHVFKLTDSFTKIQNQTYLIFGVRTQDSGYLWIGGGIIVWEVAINTASWTMIYSCSIETYVILDIIRG